MVWPESDEDCQAVVTLAGEHGACLIPYGGGTNVSSAPLVPAGEKRMVVSVDTRRMNRVLSINRANMTATVQAGITGSRLEELLGKEGLTCGHEPDSIELSTLGGWIATNASGMKKNRYGNIAEKFAEMERNIRAAIMDAGGSISHHHGVGKLRKYFVDRVASPETVDAMKSLKHAVDPQNVFAVRNNIFAS